MSPLRSSDRRKTADRIIADYGLHPASSDATGENEGDSTSALTLLRKSLLPENALSAKFATTFGPHLKELNGMVYVGSHDSGEQRVLWVRMNDKLYPTGPFLMTLLWLTVEVDNCSIHIMEKSSHLATLAHAYLCCR